MFKQFQHPNPTNNQYGPTKYILPGYGKEMQYIKVDTTPELSSKVKCYIQEICGKFLYFGRSIDNTQLHPLNKELIIKVTTAFHAQKWSTCHIPQLLSKQSRCSNDDVQSQQHDPTTQ